jgi:mitochondrial fission protein ELM1
LVADLSKVAASGAGLAITTSRRTPTALTERMNRLVERPGVFLWDGSGENPYTAMLAQSDFIIVTADSTNMVGEAAASGRPVLVFEPRGGHAKFSTMLHGLREKGIVHRFDGRLVGLPYPPLDSTDEIAQAIAERLASHRRAFGTTGAVLPPETT